MEEETVMKIFANQYLVATQVVLIPALFWPGSWSRGKSLTRTELWPVKANLVIRYSVVYVLLGRL